MRYFITFSCYGARLHGDESGSVDRGHNLFGTRVLDVDARRAAAERGNMAYAPYTLDSRCRAVVLETIQQVCLHRGWILLAAHVRSTHVHLVVEGQSPPERMMSDFKAYASRALNRFDDDALGRKRWARHGSTRWLWKDQGVRDAIGYVVEEQGEPMAVFVGGIP